MTSILSMRDTTFDVTAFMQAIEGGDAGLQAHFYADDARLRVVDPDNPPSRPLILIGRSAIHDWISEGLTRTISHRVTSCTTGQGRLAITEEEQYRDGGSLFSALMAEISDHRISRQTVLQIWDWPGGY